MYFEDLREALVNQADGDIREGLEMLKSIIEDIKAEGIDEYDNQLIDEAIDNNICPSCFGNLVPYSIGEDITEAWGRVEVTEKLGLICEECGGTVEWED